MIFTTDFEKELVKKASMKNKTIVLPEAGYSKEVYQAGLLAVEHNIAKVVFLVKEDNELDKFGFVPNENIKVINILTSELLPMLANALVVKRSNKGLTLDQAYEILKNEVYFGTMMVELGLVDGLVNGANTTTADSLRPALQIIKGKTPDSIVSSFFVMVHNNKEIGDQGLFILADCGLNECPNEKEMEQIVYDTVNSTRQLTNLEPRVSLLSFSTKGSAEGVHPQKMRNVAKNILDNKPNFVIDGEMQFDASIVPQVADKKAPNSPLKGNANILIFPDLSSGNIGYKIMQRLGGFKAIGPICQGFKKPINDVSRGANAEEIALTIAITCLQA